MQTFLATASARAWARRLAVARRLQPHTTCCLLMKRAHIPAASRLPHVTQVCLVWQKSTACQPFRDSLSRICIGTCMDSSGGMRFVCCCAPHPHCCQAHACTTTARSALAAMSPAPVAPHRGASGVHGSPPLACSAGSRPHTPAWPQAGLIHQRLATAAAPCAWHGRSYPPAL